MTATVLFFSVLRDLVGATSLRITLDSSPVTMGALLGSLYRDYPALQDWDSRLLLAINAEFATRDDLVNDGDEIALMPPVQGG